MSLGLGGRRGANPYPEPVTSLGFGRRWEGEGVTTSPNLKLVWGLAEG